MTKEDEKVVEGCEKWSQLAGWSHVSISAQIAAASRIIGYDDDCHDYEDEDDYEDEVDDEDNDDDKTDDDSENVDDDLSEKEVYNINQDDPPHSRQFLNVLASLKTIFKFK